MAALIEELLPASFLQRCVGGFLEMLADNAAEVSLHHSQFARTTTMRTVSAAASESAPHTKCQPRIQHTFSVCCCRPRRICWMRRRS